MPEYTQDSTYAYVTNRGTPRHIHGFYDWHWPSFGHRDIHEHERRTSETPIWLHDQNLENRMLVVSDATQQRYLRYLAGEVVHRVEQRLSEITANIPSNEIILNRSFGVEIECATDIARLITLAAVQGIQVSQEPYNHHTVIHWKLVNDSSVIVHHPSLSNIEVVSPPLRGADGIEQLRIICTILMQLGSKVNQTCGLHVHHDAADVASPELLLLAKNYNHALPAIDQLVAISRRYDANAYCKPWNRTDFTLFNTLDRPNYGNLQRNKNINFASIARHGTIEFRQHQGTVEFDKILNWVSFGQHMIKAAQAGVIVPTKTTNYASLFNKIGLPASVSEFLDNRASTLKRSSEGNLGILRRVTGEGVEITEARPRTRQTLGEMLRSNYLGDEDA